MTPTTPSGDEITLYLYYLEQNERTGYDTYDACIVCAPSEQVARRWSPATRTRDLSLVPKWDNDSWTSHPDNVSVELIGTAAPGMPEGITLASFHAG